MTRVKDRSLQSRYPAGLAQSRLAYGAAQESGPCAELELGRYAILLSVFARSLYRRVARIACFAVLLGALIPTLNRATAHWRIQTGAWGEICTAFGIRPAALATYIASGDPDEVPYPYPDTHCPYCGTNPGSHALPSAQRLAISIDIGADERPPSSGFVLHPRQARASAQPRAPPITA